MSLPLVCPDCGLHCPPETPRCDCGYDLSTIVQRIAQPKPGVKQLSLEKKAITQQIDTRWSVGKWALIVFAFGFLASALSARRYEWELRVFVGLLLGLLYAGLAAAVIGIVRYIRRTRATRSGQDGDHTLEDRLYKQIAQELETNSVDAGLWTQAYAEAGGDNTQTRVRYIKSRFERLLAEERARKS